MQRLTQTLRQAEGVGEPLASIFPAMAKKGWLFRRAQSVMIAAAPNVGKSALALYLAIKLEVPTLFLSADTDPFTTILRSTAVVSGDSMSTIEHAIQVGAGDYYESMLSELEHIRFVFDAGPTLEDVDLEVSAFNEVYGEPPALIVVDNLINIQCDDGDEFRGLRIVSAAMHQLARSTGACVLVLHHVTGQYEDGIDPPPRRALHGKISKYPEMILTLGKQGQYLGIACVKNRSAGGADPLAGNAIFLHCDLDRMVFKDEAE